jgi:hypothetical protein
MEVIALTSPRPKVTVIPKSNNGILLSAPNPTSLAKLHWKKSFTPDLIRLRVKVSSTSNDTASKVWLATTDRVFRAWEVYAPAFSFSKYATYSTGTPDIEVNIANYGASGWISRSVITRDTNYHTTHGIVKLNTFYLAKHWDSYNKYAQGIYCHEFGHILGLKDNRPGILDGTPDNSCMNEVGLLLGTGSNTPNGIDSIVANDLYTHSEPVLPTYSTITTTTVDSFPSS